MYRFIFTMLMVCFLPSCGYSDHPVNTYLERLSSVLDVEESIGKIDYPQFPSVSELRISPPENVISIREFLGLRECEIHQHIAERNSQIGRVATSSQLLLNDLAILASIEPCLMTLASGELKDKLTSYHFSKNEFLPNRLWHAILAGDEYRQFWFPKNINLDYPDILPAKNIEGSLVSLKSFVESSIAQDFSNKFSLEEQLGVMRFGDAGQLLYELIYIQHYLEAADRIISARLQSKLCVSNTPTPKARHFANVVTLFFIQEVQPRMVELTRRLDTLLPLIEALEAPLRAYQNENYTRWQNSRNQHIAEAVGAAKIHAKKLNLLYKQCGLLPGSNRA